MLLKKRGGKSACNPEDQGAMTMLHSSFLVVRMWFESLSLSRLRARALMVKDSANLRSRSSRKTQAKTATSKTMT